MIWAVLTLMSGNPPIGSTCINATESTGWRAYIDLTSLTSGSSSFGIEHLCLQIRHSA